ncbi:unnamed protein product [Oppiella nova]|uniref:Cytochrome P450 n=1 Tax=Oppiella nova TaxID=334625 RepID=A0A7R9MA22_9ACAR|nr:unnamed protein product [Oppiella nova]CAG2172266.1 unnamed protein product [Oppiella nova]
MMEGSARESLREVAVLAPICQTNEWCLIGLIVAVIAYYYISWRKAFSYWTDRHICGPKPIPIFGNVLSLSLNTRTLVELQWYKKYGKIFGLYISAKPWLTVADPQLIKQILVKDFNSFRNRQPRARPNGLLIKNMVRARDDDWKRVRAIATLTFTPGKLRKMYGLINHCCKDFIDSLDKDVSNGMNEVELKQLMGAYTMDVIASCAFATKTNAYADPYNPFTTKANNCLLFPFGKVNTGIYRRTLNTGASESDFFIDISRSLIQKRKKNNEKHNDFLQLLMDAERSDGDIQEASDANEAHHVNEGKDEMEADAEALSDVVEKKLTEDEILRQCFLFFNRLRDNCHYSVVLYDRLYETKDVFNEKGEIDYEVLSRLPFIDALISETLRSYPPVLRLEREAMEDVMLGNTGVKIEKGVIAEIPVYAIHHDPDHYPDPFTFSPDRFMPENRDRIQAYTYLPSGSGRLHCIGMRFALLSTKLALTQISHSFRFSRVTDTDVPVVFNKGRALCQAKRLVVGIQKR